MRAFCLIALAACATTTPHRDATAPAPLAASYDLDTHTMVPIVYDASAAQNYRVAVVEPGDGDARFVVMPRSGGGEPLVVHVRARSYSSHRFASCVGSCSTSVAVLTRTGEVDDHARGLLAAIDARAQSSRLDH
jgi:hypothetical protein